jgi:plastocyanin
MNRILIVAVVAAFSSVTSVASAQGVTVTLTEFKVALSRDTVKAGVVTFQVANTGAMSHSLHVRGPGVDKGTRDLPKGEAASLTVTLKAGTYEVFCPMSEGSHQQAGMTRTLVVTPAATPAAKKKPGA